MIEVICRFITEKVSWIAAALGLFCMLQPNLKITPLLLKIAGRIIAIILIACLVMFIFIKHSVIYLITAAIWFLASLVFDVGVRLTKELPKKEE